MANDPRQITVSIETDLDNPISSDNTMLMSGPFMVYAVVDKYEELYDQSLIDSIEADREHYGSIIAFVKNVANTDENMRGAFYLYLGMDEHTQHPRWQEILLGTHSHANLEALDKLSAAMAGLDLSNLNEDKFLVIGKDGDLFLEDRDHIKTLPDIPAYIRDELEKASGKRYQGIDEPTDSEWHHLDADPEELMDTYDWRHGDSQQLAVSNCRELYRRVIRRDNPLMLDRFLDSSHKGEHTAKARVNLDAYSVNYDPTKFDAKVYNVKIVPEHPDKILLTLSLRWKYQEDTDLLFFFDEDTLIKNIIISSVSEDKRSVSIILDRAEFPYTENRKLTVMAIADLVGGHITLRETINRYFDEGILSLDLINEELMKLYAEGEFTRRPAVPQLYLTTDEAGNVKWDNKFLPSQLFYAKSISVDRNYLATPGNVISNAGGDEFVKVVFEDVNYKLGEDFPLLIVNDFVAFNVEPDKDSAKDITYYLPKGGDEAQYDFELEGDEANKVTLIVIRQTSSESMAELLARDYVSKKDAVDILAHGTLSLDDYISREEIINYAKTQHIHTQYALREHNHDERYANYYHSHPEIMALMAKLLNGAYTAEDIEAWLNQINDNNKAALFAVLSNLGIREYTDDEGATYYRLTDRDVKISPEIIADLNAKAVSCGMDPLASDYLYDALDYILRFFEHDTVVADKVILKRPIPVKLVNGPVGGIETECVYDKDTPLQKILEDILNPYAPVEKIREILTPAHIEVEWYKYNALEGYVKVDPEHLLYDDNPSALYFKLSATNIHGQPCVYTGLNYLKKEITQEATLLPYVDGQLVSKNEDGYYLYEQDFAFDELVPEDTHTLVVGWHSERTRHDSQALYTEDIIYDNYGDDYGQLNPEHKTLELAHSFYIDLPDFYIGVVGGDFDPEEFDPASAGLAGYFYSKQTEPLTFHTNGTLVVLYEHDDSIEVFDDESHQYITPFMDDCGTSYRLKKGIYYGYYYEFLDEDEDITLRIRKGAQAD